jgi:glycosyltransferase involved in cell wall biosynthesis
VKVAVVTPYYREPRPWLERCIASVRNQTYPRVQHLLVADGHAQPWLDAEPVRHLRLDRSHGDYGNTPRAVGALLAASEGFDAIAFLDADNWLHPEHVASCVDVARGQTADFVVSLRFLARDDGSVLPVGVGEDIAGRHVDTNCMFFCRGAFHALARWALMPRPLASIGDRVLLASLRAEGLGEARTGRKTVYYLCTWAPFFRAIGENPPPYAKEPIDADSAWRWVENLDPHDARVASRLIGIDLKNAARRRSRHET